MGVVANRKKFLITIFLLFAIIYWTLFFPLLWIHSKGRLAQTAWITLLCAAVILFLLLVAITTYLVKKYNWWIGVAGSKEGYFSRPRDYGFQATQHRYTSSQQLYCPPEQQQRKQHNVQLTVIPTQVQRKLPVPTNDPCEVFVDKRVLHDKETQTVDGSISPGLYRTSLIMDVQPRTPSSGGGGSDSTRNSWFYPTLADYYKDKTLKLKTRLDKAQEAQSRVEQQEEQILAGHPDQVDYSISDTKLFLKREQVYTNLEIR